MKKSIITLALSALLALSACGVSTDGSTEDSPASGSNRPETSKVKPDATEAEAENAATPDAPDQSDTTDEGTQVLSFGESFAYEDGLQITISTPSPMTSGQWAVPASTEGSAFTVTLLNGSDAPFDPMMISLTAQSGNTEAEQIFDSENGYSGAPTTTLLPGREARFKVAFATSNPDDIVLEMSPSFEHAAALYATAPGK